MNVLPTLLIAGIFLILAARHVRPGFTAVLLLAIIAFALGGCAALPMPLQPETQDNSNMAEGGFLVLGTTYTVQEYRCGNHRAVLTDLAIMTVHTMVASWIDDHRPSWRVPFHAVSLTGAAGLVAYDQHRGCKL